MPKIASTLHIPGPLSKKQLEFSSANRLEMYSRYQWQFGLGCIAGLILIVFGAGWADAKLTPNWFENSTGLAGAGIACLSFFGLVSALIWEHVIRLGLSDISVEDSNQIETWASQYPACADYLKQLKEGHRGCLKLDYWNLQNWITATKAQTKAGLPG